MTKTITKIVKAILGLLFGVILVCFGAGLGMGADFVNTEDPEAVEEYEVHGPISWFVKFLLEMSKEIMDLH